MTRKDKGVISRFLRQFILLVSLAVIPTAVIAGTGYYPSANVSGILPINLATSVTGLLPIANGGTGAATTGAHTWFGNNTGSTAAPAFSALVAADLPNTAVTPGSYTSTNLTVDAQGRITAASNGSGGGGFVVTPTSPTYSYQFPWSTGLGVFGDLVGIGSRQFLVAADGHSYVEMSTGSVSGDTECVQFAQLYADPRVGSAKCFWSVRTGSDLTNSRIWGVLSNTAPDVTPNVHTTASPTNISALGFRYDSGADGTLFWRTWASDSASGSAVATTQSIAANTTYFFCIDYSNASSIKYYINGNLVDTRTSNAPAFDTALELQTYITTLTSSSRTANFSISALTQI